jgi:regulator of replication initiation timing
MNAARNGGSGDNGEREHLRARISDLEAQRTALHEQLARVREQRNQAIAAANDLQRENAELRRRIAELEGPQS